MIFDLSEKLDLKKSIAYFVNNFLKKTLKKRRKPYYLYLCSIDTLSKKYLQEASQETYGFNGMMNYFKKNSSSLIAEAALDPFFTSDDLGKIFLLYKVVSQRIKFKKAT